MQMLTIEEARKATGKSQVTIRRLVKRLISDDNALDKRLIVKEPQTTGGSFSYKIEKDYLFENLHMPTHGEQTNGQAPNANTELVAILREELRQKNEQINKLLERNREMNVLLRGYQDRFLLEAPKNAEVESKNAGQNDTENTVDSVVVKPPQKRKQKKVKPQKSQKKTPWYRKIF